MNKTTIEWVKNPDGTQGYSWNPITGCLNGCTYCYARKLANTRLKGLYLANNVLSDHNEPNHVAKHRDPFHPRFWQEKLYHPWRGEPKGIFVCDMSDMFGIGIPEEWTERVLNLIRLHSRNRYYLLTKQSQNLAKFSPFPDNAWVGVSATDVRMMVNALNELHHVKAKVKYLSLEPLLHWDIAPYILRRDFETTQLDWVIIGAQTKPTVYPKIEWAREIVSACDEAGIPVFLKDSLKPLLSTSVAGHDVIESHNLWAFKYFKLRHEFPAPKEKVICTAREATH